MKCRVKTQSLLAVAFCICVVHHQIQAQTNNQTLNDAEPEVISSYPNWILSIMTRLSNWSPPTESTSECKLSFSSPELQSEKCKLNLDLSYFQQFQSKLFFKYDISDRTIFHLFEDQLNPDVKIRGLLALHKDQKRPIVIFRMGINGNRDEVLAERYLLKILFEDIGAHVLMLENLTSHSYFVQNQKNSIGGMEEGLHTFYVLNKIKTGGYAWSRQVTDLHLLGISLGSQGVFLATMLDEQSQHFLKSSQVFCPLVNFQETFEFLEKPGFGNVFVDFWLWRRMVEVRKRMQDDSSWSMLRMLFTRTPEFIPKAMAWLNEKVKEPILSVTDIEKKFPNAKFSPEFLQHLKSSHSLLALNNFWLIYKNQKTPFQIVVTPNDPLVNNGLNSDRIKNKTQSGDFSKTTFLGLQGVHCALAAEYQWPFLVEVVRRGLDIQKPD